MLGYLDFQYRWQFEEVEVLEFVVQDIRYVKYHEISQFFTDLQVAYHSETA